MSMNHQDIKDASQPIAGLNVLQGKKVPLFRDVHSIKDTKPVFNLQI